MIAPLSLTWLGETLLATTILMLLVLLVRRPTITAFGPRIAYLLWLLPAARLLMPALVGPPVELDATNTMALATADGLSGAVSGVFAMAQPSLLERLWTALYSNMLYIWLAGSLSCLAIIVISHLRFRRRILADSVVEFYYRGCEVVRSSVANSPLAIGLFRRLIIVPDDFDLRFSEREREHVLSHEAEHHRHGDLWANIVAAIVLSAHWFNPVAWLAWHAFRLDQERCCDARVTALSDGEERFTYALTLAKAATGSQFLSSSLAAPIVERNEVKQRLILLKQSRSISRSRLFSGIALIVGMLGMSLILTATVVPEAVVVREAAAIASTQAQPRVDSTSVLAPVGTPIAIGPTDFPNLQDGNEAVLSPVRAVMPTSPKLPAAPPSPADVAKPITATVAAINAGANRVPGSAKAKLHNAAYSGSSDWAVDEQQIQAMIPRITVEKRQGKCNFTQPVIVKKTGGSRDRPQDIRISVCADEAMTKDVDFDVAIGKIDVAMELREAREEAIESLIDARADVECDKDIPAKAKAEILARFGKEIAKLKAHLG